MATMIIPPLSAAYGPEEDDGNERILNGEKAVIFAYLHSAARDLP
jgi:hypothetical protein